MLKAGPPGWAASLLAWFLLTVPSPARAQASEPTPTKADRAAARDAYDGATAAFERGDYVAALDGFVAANALIPSVQAMFWIAQSQDKLGRTEAAREAYEAITARGDFVKLNPEKAATVRSRLSALRAQLKPAPATPAAAEPTTPSEAAPSPAPAPIPVVAAPVQSAPAPFPPEAPSNEPRADELVPARRTVELGAFGGALLVSDSHNWVERGHAHTPFDGPAWQVGLRAAFFLESFAGVEAEWAHGFGNEAHVGTAGGSSAQLDALRAHLVGQLPASRIVPFALLGAGLLHASSDRNGSDTDLLLEAGVGLKLIASKLLVPRLDFRLNVAQKQGGGLSDGFAAHPEVLLGLGVTLGR